MRAISCRTDLVVPYRAGVALGEALAPLQPEVVFLFCSIHCAVPELLEGLYDALESDEVIVVGNSGDGYYESDGASDIGAAALGLNSSGQVRWRLKQAEQLQNDPEEIARKMFSSLSAHGESPSLAYIAASFSLDGSRIEAALNKSIHCPVIGGLSGDDQRMAASHVFANRQVLSDAIVVLAAYGDVRFSIMCGNSLPAAGQIGHVDAATDTRIDGISGTSALQFIEQSIGKPVLETDRGILSLLVERPNADKEKFLRSIVPSFSSSDGSIGLFGGVSTGDRVQVCAVQREYLMADVSMIADAAATRHQDPAAALVVSCSGRKAALGMHHFQYEVSALTDAFPDGLPLAGFPSYGEFCPHWNGHGYGRNLFHNMAYVLLLIER